MQAQAALQLAQIQADELANPQPLESQVMRTDATIELAQADLEQAQLNREYAELRAPFDATVDQVTIDPGDSSNTAGDPAISLVDVSTLYVEVDISDLDIDNVRRGQEAQVTADALPGKVFDGEVKSIAPRADVTNNIRTFQVKIEIKDTEGKQLLRPGMGVRVELETLSSP
jgi:HlyD family secretion protein